ncbi:hypothetical protein D917_10461 [Trichinella nativa]|uniref:Uncharacterized protein n=1 Tax=Trichinella nativa TaxID=6335 RepID=A0A1Y3EAD7_9BILA|nr:hypothetical protein D917_10461 [Trichinella nativa]
MNGDTGRIEAQHIVTEEIYRRVGILQEEYEAGLTTKKLPTGFCEITVRARILIDAGKVDAAGFQNMKTAEVEKNVRLPSLELPKFRSHVTEFRGFWDWFADSIHKRTEFLDGAKLTYLRGCPTDDALGSIIDLSFSNAHYGLAIQMLELHLHRPYTAVRKLKLDLLRIM